MRMGVFSLCLFCVLYESPFCVNLAHYVFFSMFSSLSPSRGHTQLLEGVHSLHEHVQAALDMFVKCACACDMSLTLVVARSFS